MHRVVSSTYWITFVSLWIGLRFPTTRQKNIGPKTEPCGTPDTTLLTGLHVDPILVTCVRSKRYDWHHWTKAAGKLSDDNLSMMRLCDNLSKAFEKSYVMIFMPDTLEDSSAARECCRREIMAHVVDEEDLQPNWLSPKFPINVSRTDRRMSRSKIFAGTGSNEIGSRFSISGGELLGIGTMWECFQFWGNRRSRMVDRLLIYPSKLPSSC